MHVQIIVLSGNNIDKVSEILLCIVNENKEKFEI